MFMRYKAYLFLLGKMSSSDDLELSGPLAGPSTRSFSSHFRRLAHSVRVNSDCRKYIPKAGVTYNIHHSANPTYCTIYLLGAKWQKMRVGHSTEDRKSTRLNSSHSGESRMPSSA